MAEYIEKAEIEKWGTCIAERNDKQELIPEIGIHLLPTADVIERSKIDKAVKEITQYGAIEKEIGNKEVANAILDVLKILQECIGE